MLPFCQNALMTLKNYDLTSRNFESDMFNSIFSVIHTFSVCILYWSFISLHLFTIGTHTSFKYVIYCLNIEIEKWFDVIFTF